MSVRSVGADGDMDCYRHSRAIRREQQALIQVLRLAEAHQSAPERFPELTVVKADQKYTRLDEFTYRYASGDFEAELTVDDEGLVAAYADWARTGVAIGPGDTEPLDAQR